MTTSLGPLRSALLLGGALGLALAPPALAQPTGAQVQLTGSYARAFSFTDSTEAAGGPGATVRLHAPLVKGVGISARVGLDRLDVRQADPIDRWEWGYWDVLWETWSQIYRDRADIDATFVPTQQALLLSGSVGPSLTLGSETRSVTAWAGPSLSYYTRRLYNNETWQRVYPTVDHTFAYTLRNYAPDKTGLAVGLDAGLSGRMQLASWLDLSGGASYRRLQFETSRDLPLNDLLTLDLGVAVRY